MKKSLSLILLCLLFCAAITMSCAHAEELGVVTNPHWKPGSSATATWDAVDGANYYWVKVNVYHNAQFIGEMITGTAGTELDVQQEIYSIVSASDFDEVDVSFSVCASDVSYVEYISGIWSDDSDLITVRLKAVQKLPTPENLSFSKDYTLSFDQVEHASWYYYTLELSSSEKTSTFTRVYLYGGSSTRVSSNIEHTIKAKYIDAGFDSETVQVRIKVQAYSHKEENPDYLSSDYTDWSAYQTYSFDFEPVKLPAPGNLSFSEDFTVSFDQVEHASWYYYTLELSSSEKTSTFTRVYLYGGRRARVSSNIEHTIKAKYIDAGFDSETVQVRIKVQAYSYQVENPDYLSSDFTEWSDFRSYAPKVAAESITLSPASPALYLGNSLYLGKTIEPEDAYYERIDWSSSDEGIVPVSTMGRITGAAVGSATVTAAIGDVTDSVEVTVYDISSNIEDPDEQNHVTDTAGDIIDDIVNSDDPDVDNTDIDAGDLPDIREDIQEGLWRGDAFFTDVVWYEENFGKYKDNWGQIQKAAKELNAQFAGAYNIEVEMHHKDSEGTDYHIGNITELENEITFTFDLPTGKHEIQSGYARKYVLVRIHKNSIEAIDASIGEDGTVTAKSDRFSDFVLVYVDEPAAAIDLSGYAKLVLPQGTTDIEASAFEGICAEVIVVPESCSHIGERAFADCPSLKYIVLAPGSEAEIDPSALAGSDAEIIYQSITAG